MIIRVDPATFRRKIDLSNWDTASRSCTSLPIMWTSLGGSPRTAI